MAAFNCPATTRSISSAKKKEEEGVGKEKLRLRVSPTGHCNGPLTGVVVVNSGRRGFDSDDFIYLYRKI